MICGQKVMCFSFNFYIIHMLDWTRGMNTIADICFILQGLPASWQNILGVTVLRILSLRGPAYVKTESPTIQQNQWKNDVILDCSLSKPFHLFPPLTWVTIFTRLGPLKTGKDPHLIWVIFVSHLCLWHHHICTWLLLMANLWLLDLSFQTISQKYVDRFCH